MTNQLVSGHYNTLIIGYNKCWKQDVNLGASINQSFTSIPHYKLISMLKYKCKLEGINVVVREESYTSKASALDKDKIPCIGDKNVSFSGKRIKRGLYCSTKGIINADVNGALNIMRKEVGDDYFPADIGFVFNPCCISF